jgi:HlyD family secretion protein
MTTVALTDVPSAKPLAGEGLETKKKAEPGAAKPKANRRTRLIMLVGAMLVLVGLIATGLIAYHRSHPAASPYRTVPAARVDITERVTATGTLQPVITSPVGAQVSGIVWKLHADYNSLVKKGDLLVELDE